MRRTTMKRRLSTDLVVMLSLHAAHKVFLIWAWATLEVERFPQAVAQRLSPLLAVIRSLPLCVMRASEFGNLHMRFCTVALATNRWLWPAYTAALLVQVTMGLLDLRLTL